MDTPQKVFDDCKRQYPSYNILNENINHIDDCISERYNYTLLHLCISYANYGLIKRCISFGADVNECNYFGKPALYRVFENIHHPSVKLEVAEILLKAGANPNIKFKDIPVIFCLSNSVSNFRKNIELLLKYGALTNEIHKYKEFIKPETQMYFRKILAKRRWVILKALSKFLSLQQQAVITANHPDRLLLVGTFEEL